MTLQQKAIAALEACANNDPRWVQLVMTLSLRTGLDPRQVIYQIEQIAKN